MQLCFKARQDHKRVQYALCASMLQCQRPMCTCHVQSCKYISYVQCLHTANISFWSGRHTESLQFNSILFIFCLKAIKFKHTVSSLQNIKTLQISGYRPSSVRCPRIWPDSNLILTCTDTFNLLLVLFPAHMLWLHDEALLQVDIDISLPRAGLVVTSESAADVRVH